MKSDVPLRFGFACIERVVEAKQNQELWEIIIIIINTLQYSKRIEGQPTTPVGSPKKLKLNLLN